MMDGIIQILLVLFSGTIVFITAFFLIKMLLENESKKRVVDYKTQNLKLITPIRLQAYERIILFLERISPDSMIVRLHVQGMESFKLQADMLSLVRAEFEHNLSQQIYMSPEAWSVACSAKENIIKLINLAAEKAGPKSPALEFCNILIGSWMNINPSPIQTAIGFIKKEIQQLF